MTLSQVAKQAGVSITTASRVFNNVPTVRPYIRERVMEVADRLNYRPNELARGLRNKFANLVTVGIPQKLSNPYFGALTEHLSCELSKTGLDAIVCNNIDRLNDTNHSSRACGTILVGPGREDIDDVVQERALVTVHSTVPPQNSLPNVRVDFSSSYAKIGQMLIAEGRQHIAYCCDIRAEFAVNHVTKFQHAEAVIKAAGGHVQAPESGTYVRSEELLAWLAQDHASIDAVLCSNDMVAGRLAYDLLRHGFDPVSDIRIVGCDGLNAYSGTWTVRVDPLAVAKATVELLRKQIDSGDTQNETIVPTTIVTPTEG